MTMLFRPSQSLYIPGVDVLQARAPASSADWWDVPGQTCVAAYAPKGAASLAASYVNLTGNATYNAAPGVAPTWDATGGWTFNGSTQYLTTGVAPASGWSMIVRFSNATSVDSATLVGTGTNAANNAFSLISFYAGNSVLFVYGSGSLSSVPNLANGVLALAGANTYVNGVSTGTISGTFSGSGQAVYIAARNNSGTADRFTNVKIQSFSIYSTTLSAGNVATVGGAMP